MASATPVKLVSHTQYRLAEVAEDPKPIKEENRSFEVQVVEEEEYEEGEEGKKKSKAKFGTAAVKLLVDKVREHKDVVLSKESTTEMIGLRRKVWAEITAQEVLVIPVNIS